MPYPASTILLICVRRLGDVLLTTPLLASLRQAYPHARIDMLVFAGTESILAGNPHLDQIISVPQRPSRREQWALLRRLWRAYDVAVSTQSGDRPLLYAWAAAPRRFSVVPTARPQDAWKRWACTAWVEHDPHTHKVREHLRLADALGIARCYRVQPPLGADLARLDALLGSAWRDQAYAVLHLSPMWAYKRWHLAGWAELARHLRQRGLRLILTGGPGAAERAYLDSALPRLPADCLDLAGRLSFAEVSALLRHCAVYVGPDTAVTHLAAASGAPCVALFGPTRPQQWAPWPSAYASDANPFRVRGEYQRQGNVLLLQGSAECVPCHQEGCLRSLDSYSRCLDELPGAAVVRAVDEWLDASAAAPTTGNPAYE